MKAIVNTHDQLVAAGGGIAILPAYSGARSEYRNGWKVYCVSGAGVQVSTDPTAHWTDYGCKRFGEQEIGRGGSLDEAKRWVAEAYSECGPWKRNRDGAYVPERVAKAHPLRSRPRKTGSAGS